MIGAIEGCFQFCYRKQQDLRTNQSTERSRSVYRICGLQSVFLWKNPVSRPPMR